MTMGKNSGKELLAVGYAAAVTIAEGKSVEEINVVSSLFMVIGDALALIASKTALCESLATSKTD